MRRWAQSWATVGSAPSSAGKATSYVKVAGPLAPLPLTVTIAAPGAA